MIFTRPECTSGQDIFLQVFILLGMYNFESLHNLQGNPAENNKYFVELMLDDTSKLGLLRFHKKR